MGCDRSNSQLVDLGGVSFFSGWRSTLKREGAWIDPFFRVGVTVPNVSDREYLEVARLATRAGD